MRKEKIFTLEGRDEPVLMREVLVEQASNALAELESPKSTVMVNYMKGNFAPAMALLGDCIETKLEIKKLSYSEIVEVWEAFREFNSHFFFQMAGNIMLAQAIQKSILASALPTSSGPASS